jgi:oligopeptidase A
MSNPLLLQKGLPEFSQIKPEHVKVAVEQAISECKSTLASVLSANDTYTWDNLVAPIDACDDILSRLWSPVSHLNSVLSSDELRQAYESCLPLLSQYGTFVGQHQGLYDAYLQISQSEQFANLSPAQRKVIENGLRDFKLSGIALKSDDKKRYGDIVTRLSELSSTFSNNVLDATQAFTVLITDQAQLSGLPDSALEAAKALAELKAESKAALKTEDKNSGSGWLFSLNIPSYLPVMMYCDNRALREQLYRAYVTRASELGPNAAEFDNSPVMAELLQLRHALSQLLGFDNFSENSLATKMANSSDEVMQFLQDLAVKSKPQAQQDITELGEFAASEFGQSDLQPWDLPYYSEKLKQARYAISDEDLRPYFPESKVVAGLFEVVKRLFGLSVKQRDGVDVWHKDVKFYDVYDSDQSLRGSFYLDLYARENKRGGAWMDDCVGRRALDNDNVQLPVAYLTCNFTQPVGDKQALFTHNEVVTLFHEFGHGIHHMLTQINASGVAGINGVPWDAVELPSQFLENWCWQPEALAFISGHYQSGETLPQSMLDKMLAAKNFQSATQMIRQLEFSLFDFTMHATYKPEQGDEIQQVLDQVREQYGVIKASDFNRFQHSFAHIFGGGYAAGYYSYKWAEVLSADAFSRFEEEGIFNSVVGLDFLQQILEKGGSQEPSELFKAFRGRAPQIDALLRHSGITA